jgi:hypothetical protein
MTWTSILNITKRHVTGLPIFKEFARFDYEASFAQRLFAGTAGHLGVDSL